MHVAPRPGSQAAQEAALRARGAASSSSLGSSASPQDTSTVRDTNSPPGEASSSGEQLGALLKLKGRGNMWGIASERQARASQAD